MKSKLLFLFALICVNSLLNSTTWHIKLDGSGDFTTIQEGINASVHSDTVLVYPGRYYENINYNGRNITVASLELTTGDEQYIYSTIIDGQRISSCVSIVSEETDTCLRGLTITNGQGEDEYPLLSGGINIWGESDLLVQCDVINCVVTNNYGHRSAGMNIREGLVFLSGNSIRNNFAFFHGGGLSITDHSQVTFDPINRCSIYNNFATSGIEIVVETIYFDELTVFVDTFTVAVPTRYFAQSLPGSMNFEYTFDILNHVLEPIDQDLYVAPDGDDTNTGLTPEDPLRTINLAVRKIASNSENPHTIHLASGIYSKSGNQQLLPFGCKPHVNIIGEDMNSTIIDGEMGNYPLFFTSRGYINSTIKNITFQNATYPSSILTIYYSDLIKFENLLIKDCIVSYIGAAFSGATSSGNVQLKNVTVDNTESMQYGGKAGAVINGITFFKAENCTFSNNVISQNGPLSAGLYVSSAGGDVIIENCKFFGNSATSNLYEGYASALLITDNNDEIGNVMINNCLFYDNVNVGGTSTIYAKSLNNSMVYFTNNTVVENQCSYGIEFKGNIDFKNNILRNDTYYEILLNIIDPGVYSTINVSYSNIDGGINAIHNTYGLNTINWLEGNIDEDPLFFPFSIDDPYQLTELSPCIDTGTPDTTGLFLPPWDLLHNHRIWDGDGDGLAIIDMGCYEYAAEPFVDVTQNQIPNTKYLLTNYPNPFNPTTTISFSIHEESEVELSIYNIKGQKIKSLLNDQLTAGEHSIVWNGEDFTGKKASSGIYFYKLNVNGKTEAVKKCLLLK
ncbi:MAG: T9SS type A sorting domain-containing protein [Candidatus Cloacimonetes bacterium]|nr:T9SS type A sorting domain-containing protein [Candidatus Cloacimonadota bacterium]